MTMQLNDSPIIAWHPKIHKGESSIFLIFFEELANKR
jgi:hypothetical protein